MYIRQFGKKVVGQYLKKSADFNSFSVVHVCLYCEKSKQTNPSKPAWKEIYCLDFGLIGFEDTYNLLWFLLSHDTSEQQQTSLLACSLCLLFSLLCSKIPWREIYLEVQTVWFVLCAIKNHTLRAPIRMLPMKCDHVTTPNKNFSLVCLPLGLLCLVIP